MNTPMRLCPFCSFSNFFLQLKRALNAINILYHIVICTCLSIE